MKPKYPHAVSALLALLITSGLLAYGIFYARSVEQKYIHALAPMMIPQSNIGSALQQTAFAQPDLLVIYGSSEMLVENTPFRAFQFFQNYPTGFNVYEVAKGGATSLDIVQALAAVGPELRGRQVVFSFTPSMFNAGEVGATAYAANFSLLHANALIFNTSISYETRQLAAQRMNEYPDTLQADPLLQFAVGQLACACAYGPTLYRLAQPLGLISVQIIRMQDHWEVLNYIWSRPNLNPAVTRVPARINWPGEIAQAVQTEKQFANNNPYGIENNAWTKTYSKMLIQPKKPGSSDAQFIQNLNNSKEWTDFDLALQVLKELGAKPLILSRPIDGRIWNAMGVSWQARKAYYDKLQKAVAPYGFPFVDFENHDGDKFFSIDQASHTSREGWVFVDQTLDNFFHGRIR